MAATPEAEFLSEYYSELEFCRAVGITRRTARSWRQQRIGPAFTKLGHALILYRKEGVRDYLAANEVQPVRKGRAA
jgi:hypothetical protein